MSPPDPAAWGVFESYEDYRGETHRAPEETVTRILETIGAQTERPPAATVRVVTRGEPFHSETAVAIEYEDGSPAVIEGGRLPPSVACGYHRLVHRDGSMSRLIVSPGTCFLPLGPAIWGWAVQLYSARSRESWGIGDLHDLTELGRWARSAGAGAILVNPLGAVAPGVPQQASPYFPSSRCFLNPLYLRIEDVPGASDIPELTSGTTRGRGLNSLPLIDRDAVYALKMEVLENLWARFEGAPEFNRFRAARGDLLRDFATHTAMAEMHGSDRSRWPSGLRDPRSGQTEEWRRVNERRVNFHEWLQWHLDEQLDAAGASLGLIQDLPVGVDPEGADGWVWQNTFAEGIGVGAPLDELNTTGQGWGLAPFDPWKLRGADYEPFIQTVRAALRHGSGLRIDHVMGLFRLYWIPNGMPSSAGTYVRYPARDLLNILALESHRAGAFIIGEDLGTVESEVREEMGRRNMLSYRLLWFEDGPPSGYPELALATVTNHDLPTVAGVWTGEDLEEQQRVLPSPNVSGAKQMRKKLQKVLGDCDDASVEEVIEGAYEALGAARSVVVMATLEDALAVRRRPNIPGTTTERPNWSMALPLPIEQLQTDRLVARIATTLSKNH